MSRRRGSGVVDLPSGVHAVRVGKKTYYYWHPNRGTGFAGKRIPLGTDARDPEFWQRLRDAMGQRIPHEQGTFKALIADYKASQAWVDLRHRTRVHYEHQLSRIEAAWGDMQAGELTVRGIYALRANFSSTPVAANHLVAVLRMLLKWGLQFGYGKSNPATEIKRIEIRDEQSARPWPEDAYQHVVKNAPEHIKRAVFLARATGQRRSDLVKMGRRHRDGDGLRFTISKLRDKPHFVPVTKDQLAVIDSWSCSDLGPWIVSPTGAAMSGDHLQSSLNRYISSQPKLRGLALKMHGLRALAACDRKMLGFDNRAIGASIGMSAGMVDRYTKHINQEALARQVRDGLERAGNEIVKSFSKPL